MGRHVYSPLLRANGFRDHLSHGDRIPVVAGVTLLPVRHDEFARAMAEQGESAAVWDGAATASHYTQVVEDATVEIERAAGQLADEAKRFKSAIAKEGRAALDLGDAKALEAIAAEISEATRIPGKTSLAFEVEKLEDLLNLHRGDLDFDPAGIDAAFGKLNSARDAVNARRADLAKLAAQARQMAEEARSPAKLAQLRAAGQEVKLRSVITGDFIGSVRQLHAQATATAAQIGAVLAILEGSIQP